MSHKKIGAALQEKTLARPVTITGTGLHTGAPTTVVLRPAALRTGIVFYRTDVEPTQSRIPALWDQVSNTMLCTQITNTHGTSVGTIEHLMAALFACDIDNVAIHIDGPEVPIVDGSSEPFIREIENAGVVAQSGLRQTIEILKSIRVQDGPDRWVALEPAADFEIDCGFSFAQRASLPSQHYQFNGDLETFRREIARARTFGFLQDIEKLWERGLAKGGSLENAVLIDGSRIVNDEGLRFPNECVRHKVLDAVGDLLLAGHRIQGRLIAHQSGHGLMNQLLHTVFEDASAWRLQRPQSSIAPQFSPVRQHQAALVAHST